VSVSVSVFELLLPRFCGVVGTPRSVGVVLVSLPPPPALAITTMMSSSTTAAAPAATRRRRM
jgi:hypothetical protein